LKNLEVELGIEVGMNVLVEREGRIRLLKKIEAKASLSKSGQVDRRCLIKSVEA